MMNEENSATPLMAGYEKPLDTTIDNFRVGDRSMHHETERGNLAWDRNNDPRQEERNDQLEGVDETILNTAISNAKDQLVRNGTALGIAIRSNNVQEMRPLLDWEKIIKQRHDDFLFQAAFSVRHAQTEADENVHFFSQQVKDLQRTIGREEPAWIGEEEPSRQAKVRAFRAKLQEIEALLKQRELLYQQLSDAYSEKIANGTEDEGIKNILSLFQSENGIKETQHNDQRFVVGENNIIKFVPANEATEKGSQEGRTLVEIGIMQIYGVDALERFRELCNADIAYGMSLSVLRVKRFIDSENMRAAKLHPDSQRNYFYSSIDSLDKLQRLSPSEWDRLIRSNAHQLKFNPYSGEAPSLQHITHPDQTQLEGIIAIRRSLRNEDFFKKATLANKRDILSRFDAKFLKQEKRSFLYRLFAGEEKKIPLTIEACIKFVKEERARSQEWRQKLYLSKPHETNQELWSWFSGGVSGERAQPPFTETDHFYRSLVIAVGSAYGMNWLNDATRPLRKEAKIEDDDVLFESMRKENLIEDPYKGLYKNIDLIKEELDLQQKEKIKSAIAKEKADTNSFNSELTYSIRQSSTPEQRERLGFGIKKQYQQKIKEIERKRRKLASEMRERLPSQQASPLTPASESSSPIILDSLNLLSLPSGNLRFSEWKFPEQPWNSDSTLRKSASLVKAALRNVGSPSRLLEDENNSLDRESSEPFLVPDAISSLDESNPETIFQELLRESDKIVAREREHLESIHQTLEHLFQEDFSQNRLCSAVDVDAMQKLFEETKETFLLQQARFHKSVNDMNHLRQTAMKNANLFFQKADSFQRKIKGGEETSIRMAAAAKNRDQKSILIEIEPLKKLQEIAKDAYQTYVQLAKIYSLRIERASEDENTAEDESSLVGQLNEFRFKQDEKDKIIVSCNGTFLLKNPEEIEGPLHTALKQNGIALVLLAVHDAWGQEGVQDFKNSTQLKRAAKDGLKLRELQQILESKFPATRPSSYFLGAGHYVPELLKSADLENDRVIRSNGRSFSYNPFSIKEASQKDVLKGEKTAAEAVEDTFLSIAQLDFFKKASLLNKYHILKKFISRFRGPDADILTVGAFKDFVKQEEDASNTWSHYLYYKFWDPQTLSQEWAGFMGFVTGIRYQPVFRRMSLIHQFAITWSIDILGEYFGQYREYRDGGTYKKLIDEALTEKSVFSGESTEVPDFQKMLQEVWKKKEATQFQCNVYQYVLLEQEYKAAVKKILELEKKYVAELLKRRIETLAEGNLKTNSLSTALREVNDSNDNNFLEKITQAMGCLTKDTTASIDEAMKKLSEVEQAIAKLSNHDLDQNVLFSSKNLETLQQTLTNQLAELRLEQVRVGQNPEQLLELHTLVVKNSDFFLERIEEIASKKEGARNEILHSNEEMQEKTEDQLEILNASGIIRTFKKVAQAYSQLADAYAIKVIEQRNPKLPEEETQQERNLLSKIASRTGTSANIVLENRGHLDFQFLHCHPYSQNGKLTQESRLLSAAALCLLKLEIADTLGVRAVERFKKQFKLKLLVNHPITVGDVKEFLATEKTEYNNDKALYLSPTHSLDQILHLPASESEKLLRSQGANFQYNPFCEREQKFISADKKTAEEGVKVVLKGLEKMKFYQNLTELNKKVVEDHFKDRFQERQKNWTRYFKSFFFEQKKIEPLTVKAFQDFIAEEKAESEAWHYYYQFRDRPFVASAAWNVIAGFGVLARINPDIINCTPINIAIHYGGHRYLLHSVTALTVLPQSLHALPAIFIAYGINRVAESWLHTRQQRIAPIR